MAAAALLLFLMVTRATTQTQLPPASAPAPAPATAAASSHHYYSPTDEFIRRSCNSTLYPSLCYSSLARYAGAVDRDPTQLALAAANVTLAAVQAVYSYVAALRRALVNRTGDERTAGALRDCVESLDNAADLTRQAAGELEMLPGAEGTEVTRRVSNAQTWMSAAMTYEDTCTDGFEAVPAAAEGGGGAAGAGWSVKEDVGRRVEVAEQYTSNALALVNGLVKDRRR